MVKTLSDLPETAKVWVCQHVLSGDRPIRYVAFQDGVSVGCHEPDHHWTDDQQTRPLEWLRKRAEMQGLTLRIGEEATFVDGQWQNNWIKDRWAAERSE